MGCDWNRGGPLQPVATGEGATCPGRIAHGLMLTAALTFAAWALALTTGTIFVVMRTLPGRLPRWRGASDVSLFRNVPLMVRFFIWFFVAPESLPAKIGAWIKAIHPPTQIFIVSVIALGVFTGARIREQVRAGISALPRGQAQAGLSLGLDAAQTYRYVILPQAFRRIIAPLTSEFLIIFKKLRSS